MMLPQIRILLLQLGLTLAMQVLLLDGICKCKIHLRQYSEMELMILDIFLELVVVVEMRVV